MHIKLIFTGKTSEAYLKEGIGIYEKRLKNYAPFEIIVTDDIKKITNIDFQKQKESECVMKNIKPNDYVVLLDEKGSEHSSLAFAEMMQKLMGTLQSNLVFVIGGAYGFDNKLYKRANTLMSLSKLTFSHQMIRLFFMEQLYRAFAILRNEPYHHK